MTVCSEADKLITAGAGLLSPHQFYDSTLSTF